MHPVNGRVKDIAVMSPFQEKLSPFIPSLLCRGIHAMINERQLVEKRKEEQLDSARSLPDMANSHSSLQGYTAVNGIDGQSEIAQRAYKLYQERGEEHGYAEEDWFRAEQELRRRPDASDR